MAASRTSYFQFCCPIFRLALHLPPPGLATFAKACKAGFVLPFLRGWFLSNPGMRLLPPAETWGKIADSKLHFWCSLLLHSDWFRNPMKTIFWKRVNFNVARIKDKKKSSSQKKVSNLRNYSRCCKRDQAAEKSWTIFLCLEKFLPF